MGSSQIVGTPFRQPSDVLIGPHRIFNWQQPPLHRFTVWSQLWIIYAYDNRSIVNVIDRLHIHLDKLLCHLLPCYFHFPPHALSQPLCCVFILIFRLKLPTISTNFISVSLSNNYFDTLVGVSFRVLTSKN